MGCVLKVLTKWSDFPNDKLFLVVVSLKVDLFTLGVPQLILEISYSEELKFTEVIGLNQSQETDEEEICVPWAAVKHRLFLACVCVSMLSLLCSLRSFTGV